MNSILADQAILNFRSVAGSPSSLPLHLEIIRDEDGFEELRRSWDRLVDQTATATPFLRFDWMSLWWRQCRADFSLVIIVVKDRFDEPQAIAPMMMGCGAGGRRQMLHLTFIGGLGHAQGERFDFIVPRGREAELTPALCMGIKLLRAEWDAVLLTKVPEESPNLPFMLNALQSIGCGAAILSRHPSRCFRVTNSWEDFENGMSGQWRSKYRRRWKTMFNEHAGRPLLGGIDLPFDCALRDLHDLHEINWPLGASLFTEPVAWRFHQMLAEKWVPEGRVLLPLIHAEGRAAAVIYGFVEKDEFFQFQHGWHPAFSKVSPGKLVMHWAIQNAIQSDLRMYDMMPGDFEYKEQLCKDVRHVYDIEAFNPCSPIAATFRLCRGMKRSLAQKSPVPLPVTGSQAKY